MSNILTIPHPSLRTVAKTIHVVDRKLTDCLEDLVQTLLKARNPKGVGLASPQIDNRIRLFATRVPDDKNKQHPPKLFINPVVVSHSQSKTLGGLPDEPFLEGCLSIPSIFGPVWRWEEVTLGFDQIIDGRLSSTSETFSEFAARVVQHELDHLDGVLFIDHCLRDKLPVYQGKGRDDSLHELSSEMLQALVTHSNNP